MPSAVPLKALLALLPVLSLQLTALTSADAATSRYEAESAALSQAAVATNHTGYSGTGFVDYTNVSGGYVEWTVNAATAGSTNLALRYANGTTTNRPMTITVNGTAVATGKAFTGTGSWDTWATSTLSVTLAAGANTIRATATTASGGPNVDYVETSTTSTAPGMAVAPYEYLGWGNPQSPTSVMSATGVKWFTLAFILSDGSCNPKWDGARALTGGSDQSSINSDPRRGRRRDGLVRRLERQQARREVHERGRARRRRTRR